MARIKSNSDHAITGNQLHQLGNILGLEVQDDTKFNEVKVKFDTVEVTDTQKTKGSITNFKEALTDAIEAIVKAINLVLMR